jgi:AcrR family transcriptional regulator
VPTGVAIRDPRGQLFDAAERVLLRAGSGGLTSRAVTVEAGVAKGVLHRHFADFDAFLAEFALDRVARLNAQAAELRAVAGSGTVAGNLAAALPHLFSPPALALIRLVIARDELRARLRAATGSRIPLLSESTALVAGYLTAERDLGRIASDADIGTLAPTLIGAAHLLFTDTDGTQERAAVARVVDGVLAAAQLPQDPATSVQRDGGYGQGAQAKAGALGQAEPLVQQYPGQQDGDPRVQGDEHGGDGQHAEVGGVEVGERGGHAAGRGEHGQVGGADRDAQRLTGLDRHGECD